MRQNPVSSIINGGEGNASSIFNNSDMIWQKLLNNETQSFSK